MKTKFPPEVKRLFWGDDLSQLSWAEHADYITATILEKGDIEAVRWLFRKVNKEQVVSNLDNYHLTPKSANFWKIYLS